MSTPTNKSFRGHPKRHSVSTINWPNEPEGVDLCVRHNGKYLDIVFNEPTGTWTAMYDGERLVGGFEHRESARIWLEQHVMNIEYVETLQAEAQRNRRLELLPIVVLALLIAAAIGGLLYWITQ